MSARVYVRESHEGTGVAALLPPGHPLGCKRGGAAPVPPATATGVCTPRCSGQPLGVPPPLTPNQLGSQRQKEKGVGKACPVPAPHSGTSPCKTLLMEPTLRSDAFTAAHVELLTGCVSCARCR